jgi:hypothetical protein
MEPERHALTADVTWAAATGPFRRIMAEANQVA